MARIEKTVFISYRRTDVYTALAVYQDLTAKGYDVFFDYTSIPSGDFEQIIISNIRARAHFILILTPTALDRCGEPGDWLRREIEIAIDEKRNIIPLFFKSFKFGTPSASEKLTGKLGNISRYNGLNVHEDYFHAAMDRLNSQFLNVSLDTVLHPISTEVQKAVREEKVAVGRALVEQKEGIQKVVKSIGVKPVKSKLTKDNKVTEHPSPVRAERRTKPEGEERRESKSKVRSPKLRPYGIGIGTLLVAVLGLAGVSMLLQNAGMRALPTPIATEISEQDGMVAVYIPAGPFSMGITAENALLECQKVRSDCKLDYFRSNEPPHTENLDAFWIDQTEITNAMFAEFLNQQGNKLEGDLNSYNSQLGSSGRVYSIGDLWRAEAGYENHPVVEVTWHGASAYCSWVNRRLPTEAEWEKAARGEDGRSYPWGNERPTSDLLNYIRSDVGEPSEAGDYPRGVSPYGVLDMAGNVSEWVNDWYNAYPGNSVNNSSYGTVIKVIRGGSWASNNFNIFSFVRGAWNPSDTLDFVGFRCAMDAPP